MNVKIMRCFWNCNKKVQIKTNKEWMSLLIIHLQDKLSLKFHKLKQFGNISKHRFHSRQIVKFLSSLWAISIQLAHMISVFVAIPKNRTFGLAAIFSRPWQMWHRGASFFYHKYQFPQSNKTHLYLFGRFNLWRSAGHALGTPSFPFANFYFKPILDE